MPDATFLNIINVNIDSIQAEIAEGKTNTGQEMQTVLEGVQTRAQMLSPNKMPMVKKTRPQQTSQ